MNPRTTKSRKRVRGRGDAGSEVADDEKREVDSRPKGSRKRIRRRREAGRAFGDGEKREVDLRMACVQRVFSPLCPVVLSSSPFSPLAPIVAARGVRVYTSPGPWRAPEAGLLYLKGRAFSCFYVTRRAEIVLGFPFFSRPFFPFLGLNKSPQFRPECWKRETNGFSLGIFGGARFPVSASSERPPRGRLS